MKLYSSSGFNIVEPDGEGGLKLTPITSFVARDDEDRTVEPIPQVSDELPHPARLVMRPDGLIVTSEGKVGDAAAAVEYFANYQPTKRPVRSCAWEVLRVRHVVGLFEK
jgi:hypothetical protein